MNAVGGEKGTVAVSHKVRFCLRGLMIDRQE